jgi:DNA-binding transcriptional ArsR family regulator
MVTYKMNNVQLDSIFSALSDSTRRAILARLASGDATVNELAKPFEISQPAISRHLKVLESAGLITRGKEAQYRPCSLDADNLKQAHDWLELYRRHWEESFDKLDSLLASTASSTPSDNDEDDFVAKKGTS